MNAIITSADAVAVDYIATTISGLDPMMAFTTFHGFEREFSVSSPDNIQHYKWRWYL